MGYNCYTYLHLGESMDASSPEFPGYHRLMSEVHPEWAGGWECPGDWARLWMLHALDTTPAYPKAILLSGNLPRALGYAIPQPPEGKAGDWWHDPTVWIDRWSGLPKNLGNLTEYIIFQAWLEENYPGRIWFDNTQWHRQPGSTRARDTLRDLLAQPQGTPPRWTFWPNLRRRLADGIRSLLRTADGRPTLPTSPPPRGRT